MKRQKICCNPRIIKFRGIDEYGVWRYGDLITLNTSGKFGIHEPETDKTYSVNHKSIQQFTGETDSYGEEIYDGDILRSCSPTRSRKNELYSEYFVTYSIRRNGWRVRPLATPTLPGAEINSYIKNQRNIVITGNIFEEP